MITNKHKIDLKTLNQYIWHSREQYIYEHRKTPFQKVEHD